jgi:uncharacterized protein (DUF952 family)
MLTLHGVPVEVWDALPLGAALEPESLHDEGFIHTTEGAADFAAALNRHYRSDTRAYYCLVIDLDRVAARWEIAAHPDLPGRYPHIYGPLNRDAVIGVVLAPRDRKGEFLPPML